jgi:hypothetical protein
MIRYVPLNIIAHMFTHILQPPRPTYVAPEERSAAAHSDKAKQDPIETWSVTQLDKKGKKKKGTLGVGNANLFFASESDKVGYLIVSPNIQKIDHIPDPGSEMAVSRHIFRHARKI